MEKVIAKKIDSPVIANWKFIKFQGKSQLLNTKRPVGAFHG
jgi:hypothetical protein